MLSCGPQNVTALSKELQLAERGTSDHLRIVRKRHLLCTEQAKAQRVYRLASEVCIRETDQFTSISVTFEDGGSIELALPSSNRS